MDYYCGCSFCLYVRVKDDEALSEYKRVEKDSRMHAVMRAYDFGELLMIDDNDICCTIQQDNVMYSCKYYMFVTDQVNGMFEEAVDTSLNMIDITLIDLIQKMHLTCVAVCKWKPLLYAGEGVVLPFKKIISVECGNLNTMHEDEVMKRVVEKIEMRVQCENAQSVEEIQKILAKEEMLYISLRLIRMFKYVDDLRIELKNYLKTKCHCYSDFKTVICYCHEVYETCQFINKNFGEHDYHNLKRLCQKSATSVSCGKQ